jgi:hypothetical protein
MGAGRAERGDAAIRPTRRQPTLRRIKPANAVLCQPTSATLPEDTGAVDPIWQLGLRLAMKLKLSIRKESALLYEGVHEIIDAQTFGRAFTEMWTQLQDRRLQKTTSIGALMEVLNEDLVGELNGAQIGLEEL